MNRRHFLALSVTAQFASHVRTAGRFNLPEFERSRVLKAAQRYLKEPPVTITASHSPRSTGGKHDYFSEGDYWWPDPKDPKGPYIQRDGMTNPENFTAHRAALMRLSVQVPALAAAWLPTRERRYAEHAARHLRAWFVDPDTLMNPHLEYAQAIQGRATGRGVGIIDTLHLVEVARAIGFIEEAGALTPSLRAGVRDWFARYLKWMTTHKYGQDERDAKNNHGTCWVAQAAEFARYTGSAELTAFCRDRYKTVLLPGQMAADGSFPLELKRTKPYGYSLFNLDAMAAVCQVLSTSEDNLWTFQLPDGRGMRKAMEFMVPFVADKKKWAYPPDVMYFDQWPVRHPSLLFAGLALDEPAYIDLWKTLNPDPTVEEVIRNYPLRQPLLWVRS
ncbi:MAG: alginate lyase family protein [Acidobacteria bacterium]|nr:alginate lyase family protein [Acidobacteriota bacterium]